MKNRIALLMIIGILLTGCNAAKKETVVQIHPDHPIEKEGIYVNLPRNICWDLYPSSDSRLEFMVLTKEKPDENQSAYFNMDLYSHSIKWQRNHDDYPFWLYQTQRGMDWDKLGELREKAENGDEIAREEFQKYQESYRSDYELFLKEDIPHIFGSTVILDIQDASFQSAQLHQLPIHVGNEVMQIPVGRLNLHGENLNDTVPFTGKEVRMNRLPTVPVSYWNSKAELPEVVIPAEDTEQVLTNASCLGLRAEVRLQVKIGANETKEWDGQSELTIPAGESAHIWGKILHSGNGVLGYYGDGFFTVSRKLANEDQRLWYPLTLSQQWNTYELYAYVEQGLDLTSYYQYIGLYEQAVPTQDIPETVSKQGSVVLRDDAGLKVELTHISWDDYAYTLHFQAENRSKKEQYFDAVTLAFNTYCYGDGGPELQIPPEEIVQMSFSYPWDELKRWGVNAVSGEDIYRIEIVELNTTEENPWKSYVISPNGKENSLRTPIKNEILLSENENYALYYCGSYNKIANPVSSLVTGDLCEVGILFENKQSERSNYFMTADKINGRNCNVITAGNMTPGTNAVIYLQFDEKILSGIEIIEKLDVNMELSDNFGELVSQEKISFQPNFKMEE